MLATIVKALLCAALLCVIPFYANALCWPVKQGSPLPDGWNEAVTHQAYTESGELVRVYQDKESGTWTITIVTKALTECMISSGEGWRNLTSRKPGKPISLGFFTGS